MKHPKFAAASFDDEIQQELVCQVTWFFATSSGLGGLLELMGFCCKNFTNSSLMLEEGCKTISGMEDSWWPMTLPDNSPNQTYLLPMLNLLRDVLSNHPLKTEQRLQKNGIKALSRLAGLPECSDEIAFSAAEMIWNCTRAVINEPQSDILKFIMQGLHEVCVAKPRVASAMNKGTEIWPMLCQVLTANRSYAPVSRPCFCLIGSLYGWAKIVEYVTEHIQEAEVLKPAMEALLFFKEEEPKPRIPALQLYDRYNKDEYFMFDLFAVLWPVESENEIQNPLTIPYNQEVLTVIKKFFESDNNHIKAALKDPYYGQSSWVFNRLQCCRVITEFATL